MYSVAGLVSKVLIDACKKVGAGQKFAWGLIEDWLFQLGPHVI